MTTARLSPPTKACHNCRRRRWKCDRSLPVCQKCLSSGSECLGYGKLFIWNQGVASRGKMMGRSFNDSHSMNNERQFDSQEKAVPEVRVLVSYPQTANGTFSNHFGQPFDASPQNLGNPNLALAMQTGQKSPQIHFQLTDPLLQHLNSCERDYMSHFTTRLCADMVAFDVPGQNPWRDLVPATASYPFLLQIMLANSALHVYNISRDPTILPKQQEQSPDQDSRLTLHATPRSKFYQDALNAKQEALSTLAQFITLVDASTFDLVLAAILLFVNYDLIESGKDQWKPHIEGARKMIGLLDDVSYRRPVLSRVRICLLSDFLVFYILGSTFRLQSLPQLFPASIDIEPILQHAETNNYLCCPAPLLRIMLQSFTLSNLSDNLEDPDHQSLNSVKALLELALAFDPVEWLRNFRPASPKDDLSKRLHVAAAHRCAVCIYLARFVPYTSPLLDPHSGVAFISLTGLATEIVHHLSHLTPEDTLFKSISWPLFLAGAEADDQVERDWIMSTLDSFYSVLRWGYIRNAKQVLEAIWGYKAAGAACWVTEVRRMGTEMLIA